MATADHHKRPLPTPEPPESYSLPDGMTRTEFHAMGTTISLLLPVEDVSWAGEVVRTLFSTWEQQLSRFLPESELSQLNKQAGRPVVVSPLLFNVLETALQAARTTNGLYDPTLLPQLKQIGYDRTFEEVATQLPGSHQRTRPGGQWRTIQLDRQRREVLLPAGVNVEFGGIAKGMAVDAAIDLLRERGVTAALVNAGGDLAVLNVPPQEQQWPIAVPGKDTQWVLPLRRGAVATSGISRRHWRQGDQERHHLIDPRTGLPSQNGLWSVTVVAERCMQAEVAAKVAFLLGAIPGCAFLQDHKLAGVLIDRNGSWFAAGDWPREIMTAPSAERKK